MNLEAEITRLTLGPGDVLAIRSELHLTPADAQVIAEHAQSALAYRGMHGVPVLVTGPDLRIEVEGREVQP
jgi:hypothetical protein